MLFQHRSRVFLTGRGRGMQKLKAAESIEQRGMRMVRLVQKVPRFRRARETKSLIEAMQRGDNELALWLVRQGFYPHGSDGKGRSVLWWASSGCRAEIIRELVKRGAVLPDDVLTGPINARNKEIVRLLIRKGANVNSVASTYSPIGHFHFKQVADSSGRQGESPDAGGILFGRLQQNDARFCGASWVVKDGPGDACRRCPRQPS